MLQTITVNLSGPIRHDTMEGRQYLVAPMVMMTAGVHKGSSGSIYYPKSELEKTPEAWNMKPVVVYHPTANGKSISACSPDILSTRKVGLVMNAHFDGKLRAEAWLEEDRIAKVDNRIAEALEKNELMELSTGLYTDNESKEGEFEGKSYSQIARNHRPDHLALLPDKKGACSIGDGAGLLQTNALSHSNVRDQLHRLLHERFDPKANTEDFPGLMRTRIEEVFPEFVIFVKDNDLLRLSYTVTNDKVELSKDEPEKVVLVTEFRTVDGTFVGNALHLPSDHPPGENAELSTRKINDLPDSVFAFILPGGKKDEEGKTIPRSLRKMPIHDAAHVRNALARLNQASISPAQRRTAFGRIRAAAKRFGVTVGKSVIQKFGTLEEKTVNKEEFVLALIANEATKWGDDDEEYLLTLEEDHLEKMEPVGQKPEIPNPKPKVADPPAAAKENEPITAEQYVSNAPPEIRDMLAAGLASHNRERAELIKTITTNERNIFTPEQLAAKSAEELSGLAALAKPPASAVPRPSYAGASVPVGNESKQKPLLVPTMNYETK